MSAEFEKTDRRVTRLLNRGICGRTRAQRVVNTATDLRLVTGSGERVPNLLAGSQPSA